MLNNNSNDQLYFQSNAQLQKWRAAIPRKDLVFEEHNVICELHFQDSDIIRWFETKLPDGTTHRIERNQPALVQDAVPSIFPNLPHYLSKNIRPRKPPTSRTVCHECVLGENYPGELLPSDNGVSSGDNNEAVENVPEASGLLLLANAAESREAASFGKLEFSRFINSLDSVKLPGLNWARALVGRNVVFVRIGHDFVTERSVIIPQDMRVKFIFRGLEVMVPGIERVTDVGDIGPMVMSVDGLRACPGVPNSERTSIGCLGFVPIDAKSGGERKRRAKMRCPPCTVGNMAANNG
ncbi:uncharacterized protein LOC124172046 [Ischnura elegans]|uniref:uncharacterized protein LOC124172046 n=1 Tax=Ischnura elegans TaxID=197161 RepID=UPI001ED8B1E9|nr:uncharacterized protein LOC124172046 [Ischnura elegans]